MNKSMLNHGVMCCSGLTIYPAALLKNYRKKQDKSQ
jgi:hypothetical protein